jgi:uncharacterized protein DUF4432
MYTHGRLTGCRVSLDYRYKEMGVAFFENEQLEVGVLVDKGADVFQFRYKPADLDFLWQSPMPMRRPFVATSALPEGAFHDYYYGGWQEVLPSAGWASEPYQGTFQGLHGEVSLLPFEAELIENSTERAAVRFTAQCYRSPLRLERTLSIERNSPALFIKERLVNQSTEPFAVMWGHHPAFGEPFLDESCLVQTPAHTLRVLAYHQNGLWEPGDAYQFPTAKNRRTGHLQDVTRVLPASTRSVDVISFWDLDAGWYGLTNQRRRVGFGMAWDVRLFKCLWMWQVYGGHHDYPWYGRTYNCALEPFTSWPPAGISTAVKNGSALVLSPSQAIETELVAVAYEAEGVKQIDRRGRIVR